MPERVTKEERAVSLAIEKARDAKELLHQSLYDNNRLPDEKDDRVEKVKIKRPKAEKDKTKIENNDGTHSGYGKGGEETHFKKSEIKKNYLREGETQPYLLQMNQSREYSRGQVEAGLSALGITENQAKSNSQSAEHLEMFLNINNPHYPIPRDRMVRILTKKYNVNI